MEKSNQLKALALIATAGIAFAAIAHAKDARPPEGGPFHEGPCGEMKLSDAQRKEMRDQHLAFEEKKIDLDAAERHARLNFEKVVKDGGDEKAVRAAAAALTEKVSEKIAAEESFKVDLLTKVLKADQREAGMHCPMVMGHGGPFEGRNEHGPRGHGFGHEEGMRRGPAGHMARFDGPHGPREE